MKKILALVLVLLSVAGLSACSGGAPGVKTFTLGKEIDPAPYYTALEKNKLVSVFAEAIDGYSKGYESALLQIELGYSKADNTLIIFAFSTVYDYDTVSKHAALDNGFVPYDAYEALLQQVPTLYKELVDAGLPTADVAFVWLDGRRHEGGRVLACYTAGDFVARID